MVSFWGWGMDQKLFVGSTYVVEQLLFAMFFSIMIFFFTFFSGSFLTFWALVGYCWGQGRVQKLYEGLLM